MSELPLRNDEVRCQSGHTTSVTGIRNSSGPCSTIARWLIVGPGCSMPICDARKLQFEKEVARGMGIHIPCKGDMHDHLYEPL